MAAQIASTIRRCTNHHHVRAAVGASQERMRVFRPRVLVPMLVRLMNEIERASVVY
jgi:hypothetical protein